jgi:hypothetical protein
MRQCLCWLGFRAFRVGRGGDGGFVSVACTQDFVDSAVVVLVG